MKYMLLIHQGTTPTPRDPEAWATLSGRAEGAVYAAYKAINETPGVTPGVQMQPPETATTVRVQDGKTLTTDGPFVETKEAIGGYLLLRGRRPRRRDRAGRADPGGAHGRRDRGAPDRGVVAILEQAFRDAVGTRPRCADRLPRRLRPRRGSHAGGVRDRRGALAARRRAQPTPAPGWSRRRATGRIDRIRRDRTLAAKTRLLEVPEAAEDHVDETTFPDERLELVFTCCHPALADRGAGRAHAAHARRADHRRDRTRVPGARGRRWRSGWCGRSARSRPPASRSACRPTTCCPIGSRPCSRSST